MMKARIAKLLFVFSVAVAGNLYGQPSIPEDRMYLTVSPDVAKLEQDIYLPNFPGKERILFIRWVYDYSKGLLMAERAFMPSDFTRLETEKLFKYNSEGKLIRDSTHNPSVPVNDSHTIYEFNSKGILIETTQLNTTSQQVYRIDTYKKYRSETSYEKVSQFFGDDNKKTIQYTSVYENGFKKMVIYGKGFPPVQYEYDSDGRLIMKNSRKYFYKLDERGNAIATVQIERGMRIYNFIRITYTDGAVTGSLDPDTAFIQKWDNQN